MLRHLAFALPALIDPPQVYHGRAGNLDVRPPRLEAEIEVDGQLTEEAWGPNLKIPGAAITKANVDEKRFWGNLQPPTDPVQVVD